MTSALPQLTLAEFDVWALLPENIDTEYEYICGEVVLRAASDYWAAVIATQLTMQMMMYVQQHKLGHVMGAKIGFCIGDERYVPIASYTENSRWIDIDKTCYMPFTPTLVIESVSSLRHPKHLRRKIQNYLHHEITVWVIHAEDEEVEMYRPNQAVHVLRSGDILSGDAELAGFSISLSTLFDKS